VSAVSPDQKLVATIPGELGASAPSLESQPPSPSLLTLDSSSTILSIMPRCDVMFNDTQTAATILE